MVRRILIVSSQVRSVHSGVGTYAAMILRGLEEAVAHAEVTVATWSDEIDRESHPSLRWLDLGPVASKDPTPGKFWTLGKRLVAALEDGQPEYDVVHFLDAREGHAFVRSKRRGSANVIGTVHDDYAALVGRNPMHYRGQAADPFKRFLFHRWLRRLERRVYRKFDLLMVNSGTTATTVRRAYRLDDAKMTPVTLTIEPAAVDESIPLRGDPSLLFVGGNFYRKGLDTCVAALPKLREQFPDPRLHVVGSCSSEPRIRALAESLGVLDAIEFHGHVSPRQAAARMAGAHVFVMPSRTEALGLVYLEAMRAGVPVIAGNRGGVREIVREGKSGLTIDPTSADDLVQAVDALAHNPELRERLVAGGRRILETRTPERLIEETLRAYGLGSALSTGGTDELSPLDASPLDALPPLAGAPQDEHVGVDADLGVRG